jgi:hypothetical protein
MPAAAPRDIQRHLQPGTESGIVIDVKQNRLHGVSPIDESMSALTL